MNGPHRRGRIRASDDAARFDRIRSDRPVPGGAAMARGSLGFAIIPTKPPRAWVLLSGAGPTYTFTRTIGEAGGAWSEPNPAATGACDESNGLTGLAGKRVEISLSGGRWVFAFKRIGGCTPKVCVILRDASTGDPIAGATITVTKQADHSVIGTGTTDADGGYCTAPFGANVPYNVKVEIDSAYGPTATFNAPYNGVRPCEVTHEYDFCQSQFCLTVTDCVSGGAITGLHRGPTVWVGPTPLDPSTRTPDWFDIRASLTYTRCSTRPPFAAVQHHYLDSYNKFDYDPITDTYTNEGESDDGGRERANGAGVYCELVFALVERPYSCSAFN